MGYLRPFQLDHLGECVAPEERGEYRAGLGLAPREVLGHGGRDERHGRPAGVGHGVARQQRHEPHVLLAPEGRNSNCMP